MTALRLLTGEKFICDHEISSMLKRKPVSKAIIEELYREYVEKAKKIMVKHRLKGDAVDFVVSSIVY